MAQINRPGRQHEVFVAWAKTQGVKIDGVKPAEIQGRGLGIVAQRRIEVQTILALDLLICWLIFMLGWGTTCEGACFCSSDS